MALRAKPPKDVGNSKLKSSGTRSACCRQDGVPVHTPVICLPLHVEFVYNQSLIGLTALANSAVGMLTVPHFGERTRAWVAYTSKGTPAKT